MTADELRALTEQGPCVAMVARTDMLALLDELAALRAPRDGAAERRAAEAIARTVWETAGVSDDRAEHIGKRGVEAISGAALVIVPAERMVELLELERGWQPIETAPRTSKPTVHDQVLRPVHLLGHCIYESAEWRLPVIEVIWWDWIGDEGRWWSNLWDTSWPPSGDIRFRPTHWMPLPQPPTMQEDALRHG